MARKLSPSGEVLDGIFAGMVMPTSALWGGGLARLAGSYEEELAPYLRQFVAAQPETVIDIGAADGYYAVGLALMLPTSHVYAYEIDPKARELCHRVVEHNDVTNVTIRGRMTPNELRRRVRSGTFVLSDVEGYEDTLFDPTLLPSLTQASMIVELHEFAVPGVTHNIVERFRASHHIDVVDAVDKSGAGRPSLAHLTDVEADAVVDEGRPTNPRMQWIVMIPRRT
jgi:Met-10+ like-protein